MFLIHQCVDSTKFEKIVLVTITKEAWETVEKYYHDEKKHYHDGNKLKKAAI